MMNSTNQKVNGAEPKRQRRMRSVEEKREIAEASMKAGASISEVAERYGAHSSQVRKWRRLYRNGALGSGSAPALLAVRVDESAEQTGSRSKAAERGIIHIELARARVSIEGTADAAAVRAVLECLAR
jgi:transposase-like protein